MILDSPGAGSVSPRPAADINEYVRSLIASPRLGYQVTAHRVRKARRPVYAAPDFFLGETAAAVMRAACVRRLYNHQAHAVDNLRHGRHTVVSTPTASGKTLIYNLPVMEAAAGMRATGNTGTVALYVFPLKALAQDQLKTLTEIGDCLAPSPLTAAIYDGDTPTHRRRKIREHPPDVILTNPEMLHLSFLPYHRRWGAVFRSIRYVVVDEVHTYRGVLGAHMALVLRRLIRVLESYGSKPTFVFSSATVANPAGLAQTLTGLPIHAVTKTGAPVGKRHILLMDPETNPAATTILLLRAALHRNLRTIVYTRSRKMAELIALWSKSGAGRFAGKISVYRAGLLPAERRGIEAKLASGELLAVVSTSALELGIDIGDLDLCLLLGYPGTMVAARQREGRVGRSGRDSATVMIAGDDALDRYFLHRPDKYISHPPEAAVLDPENDHILEQHLVCAAVERPLRKEDPLPGLKNAGASAKKLTEAGRLVQSADGRRLHPRERYPHRKVTLRGTGNRFVLIDADTGKQTGEIDDYRAYRDTHPGAVYLHGGRLYRVESLDASTRTITVRSTHVDYYTRVLGESETEILTENVLRPVWGTHGFTGRLRVTDRVTAFEQWRIRGRKKIGEKPLDLPPQIFETEGIWFYVPDSVKAETEAAARDFPGGIHAVEHAAIGIFPLFVLVDRIDLGGLSTACHPQSGQAAVFIYDSIPGGAGLTRPVFDQMETLLQRTLTTILDCDCDTGCPACVHSPKCGSGNRPIDKAGAVLILEALQANESTGTVPAARPLQIDASKATKPVAKNTGIRYGVLDVETQRSAQEVGGWHRADKMGVSCAVLYDAGEDRFFEFREYHLDSLIGRLETLDLVVGFNIRRFDYRVLGGLTVYPFADLPTLDMLETVQNSLGFRLSLNHLAEATLGENKTADGLQALAWWQEGKIDQIIAYCKADVDLTRRLYLFGKENGYLLFRTQEGILARAPVTW